MLTRRRFAAATGALFALRPLLSSAQQYPTRAIRIVVPWPPGGLVDTGGRIVAEALTRALGQSAVVENVAGAAGNLGAEQVARGTPDGHVLLMGTSSIAIDVAGGRKVAFDPRRDLVPVALVADTANVVIVPAKSPFRSVADVIAAARAKPGELTFGTPGIGSPAHLFGELFAQLAGTSMLHVPYSRTPAMNDLIGGRLSLMFATIPVAMPQIRSGTVRALAVTGAARFPTLPDVPTVAESGVAGYDAGQWLGVFAPRGTPEAIVVRLNAEIGKAIRSPAVAQQFEERGMIPLSATPAEFAARFDADVQKWSRVMRAGDIRLE